MTHAHAKTVFLPVAELAPLDYRYALDAAMPTLAAAGAIAVRCKLPAVLGDVRQRVPLWAEPALAQAGLWVEPMLDDWRTDVRALAAMLPKGAPLAIIASQPLARLLPERRAWPGNPLGLTTGGIHRLRTTLVRTGFTRIHCYGAHSALSIALGALSAQAARWGRPEVADRLHFAARLHYCAVGTLAPLATVALVIAEKGGT